MTTFASNLELHDTHPAAACRAGRETVVRWDISVDALCAAAGGVLNGHAGGLTEATLEWRVRPEGAGLTAAASLRLRYGPGADAGAGACRCGARPQKVESLPLQRLGAETDAPLDWSYDAGLALEHIDAGASLRLTIRRGPGDPPGGRVVYARTDVLERLGLAGGVYDGPLVAEA